jgi:predicted adenylyl cyclase CyaB
LKNLEIKSRYSNHRLALGVVKKLNAKYIGVLNQRDTYFNVKSGRLKMRVINNKSYELIHYIRANSKSARLCNYEIFKLKNHKQFFVILKKSLGVKCVIVKKRILYIYENVRIHIDTVKNLGKFLEFEVVCKDKKDKAGSVDKMHFLMNEFKIKKTSIVPQSYSDLILGRNE